MITRKIPAVNYKTKAVTEIDVSVLAVCNAPDCKEKPMGAIIFDEPYGQDRAYIQGEHYLCEYHMNALMEDKK